MYAGETKRLQQYSKVTVQAVTTIRVLDLKTPADVTSCMGADRWVQPATRQPLSRELARVGLGTPFTDCMSARTCSGDNHLCLWQSGAESIPENKDYNGGQGG